MGPVPPFGAQDRYYETSKPLVHLFRRLLTRVRHILLVAEDEETDVYKDSRKVSQQRGGLFANQAAYFFRRECSRVALGSKPPVCPFSTILPKKSSPRVCNGLFEDALQRRGERVPAELPSGKRSRASFGALEPSAVAQLRRQ
jgi:hypothetical protein